MVICRAGLFSDRVTHMVRQIERGLGRPTKSSAYAVGFRDECEATQKQFAESGYQTTVERVKNQGAAEAEDDLWSITVYWFKQPTGSATSAEGE